MNDISRRLHEAVNSCLHGPMPRSAILALAGDGMLIEFGVASGASLTEIAKCAFHRRVFGFDWFEGLPEPWCGQPKGAFTTHGVVPEFPGNVEIVRGLVEDTLPLFLEIHTGPIAFVHFDLDLYSPTRFCLAQIAPRIFNGTIFSFDEIVGHKSSPSDENHEEKAFREFLLETGLDFELIFASYEGKATFRIKK